MTFGEARAILRNDVLAEASTDYYSDDSLLQFLLRAAKELALAYGFPVAASSVTVSNNATSFSLPNDAANVRPHAVSFNGFGLRLAPYALVLELVDQASVGAPRYYAHDPKRGNLVFIAPKAPAGGGNIFFEYVRHYDITGLGTGSTIWGGLFPAFHELVVYSAAARAFDASLESERAAYYGKRAAEMGAIFAVTLNAMALNEMGASG
jgi:hypothetical protein